jgi:ribonuclease HI
LLHHCKDSSTQDIVKGKKMMVEDGALLAPRVVKKGPNKPWIKPPVGWVKFSTDRSFGASDHSAGAGMVLRDTVGTTIFTACRFMDDCDGPLEAEIRACVEGLDLAIHRSPYPIIVETDCAQLVEAINSSVQDRSPFLHWVSEIRTLCNQEHECVFVKVERSQVRVSHDLANYARLERLTDLWLGSGPDVVLQALEHEQLVTPPA